jgi:hypothetical protein
MVTRYSWYEPYELAVLETDWENKIENRIDAAESAIRERKRILSLDHGGTPEEQQSLLDALNGLKSLRQDVARWERNTAQAARGGLDEFGFVGGWGPVRSLVSTSNASTVAVPRTLPAMVTSASDTTGWCSANP